MKRTIIFLGMLLILISSIATAETIDLGTMDYLEIKTFFLNGNVTLNPHENITFLMRFYDLNSNITIYNIKSHEIEINENFVNDTKIYILTANDENEYKIAVNYESVQVPPSLQEIIDGFEAIIDELIANNTLLLSELSQAREALNQSLDENSILIDEIEKEKEKYQPILEQLRNTSSQILLYENYFDEMRKQIESLKEYKDPFALFPNGNLYFNVSSAIIAIIIVSIIIMVFSNIKSGRPIPIYEQIKTIIFKQKSKRPTRELESSPLDDKVLKSLKEGKE